MKSLTKKRKHFGSVEAYTCSGSCTCSCGCDCKCGASGASHIDGQNVNAGNIGGIASSRAVGNASANN